MDLREQREISMRMRGWKDQAKSYQEPQFSWISKQRMVLSESGKFESFHWNSEIFMVLIIASLNEHLTTNRTFEIWMTQSYLNEKSIDMSFKVPHDFVVLFWAICMAEHSRLSLVF
jgi:hypothetical protein